MWQQGDIYRAKNNSEVASQLPIKLSKLYPLSESSAAASTTPDEAHGGKTGASTATYYYDNHSHHHHHTNGDYDNGNGNVAENDENSEMRLRASERAGRSAAAMMSTTTATAQSATQRTKSHQKSTTMSTDNVAGGVDEREDSLLMSVAEGQITQGDRLNAIKASRRIQHLGTTATSTSTSTSVGTHKQQTLSSPIASVVSGSQTLAAATHDHATSTTAPSHRHMTTRRSVIMAAQSAAPARVHFINHNAMPMPKSSRGMRDYLSGSHVASAAAEAAMMMSAHQPFASGNFHAIGSSAATGGVASSHFQATPSFQTTAALRRSTRSTSGSLNNVVGFYTSNVKRY